MPSSASNQDSAKDLTARNSRSSSATIPEKERDDTKGISGDVEKQVSNDDDRELASALDKGEEGKLPAKLVYVPFVGRKQPREPYPSLEEAPVIPSRSILSEWTFTWIQPLLILGYQRTLVPTDLWKMPPEWESAHLADVFMANFERRKDSVEAWNKRIEDGTVKPGFARKAWWKASGRPDGKRNVGMALAMSDTFFWTFWSAGFIKIIGDTASVTSPLVTKALIEFGTEAYLAARGVPGYTAPSVGRGLGLAFGLWGMQIVYSFCQHQSFYRSMGTGVLLRGTIISAIFRKSLKLSGEARKTVTNGRLVNHISTDVTRIDFCCQFFHMSWTAFVELGIIIGILVANLGVASLAGISMFFISIPIVGWGMKSMYARRVGVMVFTDQRVKLIQELLGGMRVLKFFAWEVPYLAKLNELRRREMSRIRGLLILRAGIIASAMSIPILATVVAFIVFSGLGNAQNAAIIFTSLSLFNLLRMPLLMMPMAFSTIADCANACNRLTEVFLAEERPPPFEFDRTLEYAIQVDNADFKWEAPPPESVKPKSKKEQAAADTKAKADAKEAKEEAKNNKKKRAKGEKVDEEVEEKIEVEEEVETLQLSGVTLKVPRGSLTAIVGPVGSGKSSLLQALIGEMKRIRGQVRFSGPIAYCAQEAWIQNCTLRANILFGRPFDQDRYDQVISDSCLSQDIAMLPGGDMTEIGEKGITLSGGQKQRVNIARSLYANAEIYLLDDPLSAVDAHVGQHLFTHAICGSLAGKTRILATHALHFLPSVDYVICLDQGKIVQQGTYAELLADSEGAFSLLIKKHGGGEEKKEQERDADKTDGEASEDKEKTKVHGIMQDEERLTGAVKSAVYKKFLIAGNGQIMGPLLLVSLVLLQAATIMSSLWLSYWTENRFPVPNGVYMGVYAALGGLQAIFTFLVGVCTVTLGFNASKSLHSTAITGVFRAPMSFFDTSPLGRILNRFSKDIDAVDNTLSDALRMALTTLSGVLSSVIIIATVQPYFLAIAFVLFGGYALAAAFYRASARELKRLDNFLRSAVYSHFSESLGGLATIRAYGEEGRFLDQNTNFIDIEQRAYFLTIVNQRWLGIRLDFIGGLLTLSVALIGVGGRTTINPAQIGLILSFALQISSVMAWAVRQVAEFENEMNSVERLLHYSEELEREAPAHIEKTTPPSSWPSQGTINFKEVVMRYRAGLPFVLKGLSLNVGAGEKIGIVGRTGAGKSSIMISLFRIAELASGSIEIDGVDITSIGLTDLRQKIAIIPQDALLFNGTLRSNLDPFQQFEDAVLWNALKRAYLQQPGSRFTLDLLIDDEGRNLSVGERSLVSLARALVRDSKIIVLDEATASVDIETDSKIQETIQKEFKDKTLLCIAHRIRTILNYDRVMVMDDGKIAELDTPLALYRQEGGIFRSMCDQSNVSEADILNAAADFA